MKSGVQEILERAELAERCAGAIARTLEHSPGLPEEEERWLRTARHRLANRVESVHQKLEAGLALPELRSLRQERAERLERAWLAALTQLFAELTREVGAGSPLVEALFPHQRFEKLERGGSTLRAYRADFARRRATAYVKRLAADEDYPFLRGMLETMDRATENLAALGDPEALGEDAAEALRSAITAEGEKLNLALRQANALCEAALIDAPERYGALPFHERPKKRGSRSVSEAPSGGQEPDSGTSAFPA